MTHKDLAALAPVSKPFTRAGWVFELKYDGFRALASNAGGVRLISRRGTDLLNCFPEIRVCLEALPPVVLDGELVMLDEYGRPQFHELSKRFRLKKGIHIAKAAESRPAVFFAFDLLELREKDLRRQQLSARKTLLKRVLKGSERVRYVEHVGEEGEKLFKLAEGLGLEGIVAKPLHSAYYRGRSSGWLKMKTTTGRQIDESRRRWNE